MQVKTSFAQVFWDFSSLLGAGVFLLELSAVFVNISFIDDIGILNGLFSLLV